MTCVNDGMSQNALLIGSGLGGTTWRSMFIGSSAAAAAVTNRRLGSELTSTNGGGRKTLAQVTRSTRDTGSVGFDNTMRFVATWAFTGNEDINEFGVGNSDTADTSHGGNTDGGAMDSGQLLLRDVFATGVLAVIANDTVGLTIDVIADDKTVDQVGQPSQVIPNSGIVEILTCLLATPFTVTGGGSGTAGTRWTHIAMDDSNTAAASSQTALVSEFTASGLARATATVTNVTTSETNDTTQFERQFTISAPNPTVDGTGVFNASSGGDMLCRFVFRATLNLSGSTDLYTQRTKIVHVTS